MRRRHFLRAMAAVSAVAADLPVMIPVQDPLDAALGDVEAMRALGQRYLDLHPEETAAAGIVTLTGFANSSQNKRSNK